MSDLNDRNATDDQNENPAEHSPAKRKRGRPKSQPEEVEKTSEDGSDAAPVVKRRRGRPKGSKNKNPKPKPEVTGPPRPRGRPRKYPPKDENAPKRGRGRPRKNESQTGTLPTMVQKVDAPITNDPVPPDEMFSD